MPGPSPDDTPLVEPLALEPTPSVIARRLRDAIGGGRLPPGARLGEARLARELGVSRGPLREAMQRLTQEGLLVSVRHRGLTVADLGPAEVRDLYLARTAVERAAAAEVVRRSPVDAADRLGAVLAAMADAADAGRPDEVGRHDVAFHEALVELSSSPRLQRAHATLLTETRMCIHAMGVTYPADDDARVAEHRAIADAVLAGDADLADRLLVRHMDDALERLLTGDAARRLVADPPRPRIS